MTCIRYTFYCLTGLAGISEILRIIIIQLRVLLVRVCSLVIVPYFSAIEIVVSRFYIETFKLLEFCLKFLNMLTFKNDGLTLPSILSAG